MRKLNIAVVGATGVVGNMFLKILKERKIHIKNLYLYASEKSENKLIKFKNKEYSVIKLCKENILNKQLDYALFSAGEKISKEYAKYFVEIGATVIDNSSAFRMDKDIPLIVPEVNGNILTANNKLIANPNCSTIQCMAPLFVLNKLFKLKRVDFTTYQAVSGSGLKGINDLINTSNNKKPSFYPYPIYNNCLPHIGDFAKNNYTKEEIKMINETQKILNLPNIEASATCVRVPIKNSHSVEIDAEFKKPIDEQIVYDAFKNFNSIVLTDDVDNNIYPYATLATNKDEIFVGRIRLDMFNNKKLHLFCVADNLRKGAATNAVQILEYLENNNIY